MGWEYGTHGRGEECIQYLVGRPECKWPLGKARRRWEDNIRKDLRDIVWEGVDWMHLTQNRVQWRDLVNMNMVMVFLIP